MSLFRASAHVPKERKKLGVPKNEPEIVLFIIHNFKANSPIKIVLSG